MNPQSSYLEFHATKMLHTAQGKQLLDIRFQLDKGRTLALYGPSGAGKTTLLRILAGLTDVTSGLIRLNGEAWLDTANRIHVPTRRRAIGFVFQDFALFPNLTVREQLAYALPAGHDQALIDELLALMELEALQHQRPMLLSGGQQQRVALARAIARQPGLLLLDEPLSALDEEMRCRIQEYILKAQQRFHLTTLLVSHYLPEILRLADTAIVLDKGRIAKQAAPGDIFPASDDASIRISGRILQIGTAGQKVRISIDCAGTIIQLTLTAAEAAGLQPGQTVTVFSHLLAPQIIP